MYSMSQTARLNKKHLQLPLKTNHGHLSSSTYMQLQQTKTTQRMPEQMDNSQRITNITRKLWQIGRY